MGQLHITPAAAHDVVAIHEMITELSEHLGLAHEVVATEGDIHNALFGPQRQAEVLLARLDGAAVGFALYYGNYSTFRGRCGIHLEDLYVRPVARGLNIGRRLLAELARITLERGCTRLEWWVLAEDAKAVAFYEHMGATAKDEWTVYRLRGDALRDIAAGNAP
ncbi:GNAT family N-acetyltransferase [Sulfurivermis fontis]|uniref:GNAT family N-acetyltransferase n=1 Tax=Sulfurivermis fontis TaxID=1972068 RepID=UPI000FD96EC8|nr:GNAT family N-acetyltransferase [Sulfurivermis fontis]